MAWLPGNARHNLLAAVTSDQWNAWADGASIDRPTPPKIYGCRINQNFADTSEQPNILYKKGMQGQFLGLTDKGNARIFIQGVTEGPGFTNRIVPRKYVDKGKPWNTDIKEWELHVQMLPSIFDTQDWASTSIPDTTVLGKTITRLLTAFRHSPPHFVAEKLTTFIDKANIVGLSQTIIHGIKDAGLYDVLSRPDGNFSVEDLCNAARYRIRDVASSDKGGVYARFHKSSSDVTYWKPNSTYCYVGKTGDYGDRFRSHQYSRSAYGELTRCSSALYMFALCTIRTTADDGLFYLTEQIFLCLLQTYRTYLMESTIDNFDPDSLQFIQPAKYFIEVSNEVFRMTGWRGGVRRPGFNITYGANCSSPLLEYASRSDRTLFIRTDADIKDRATGLVVPLAIYRRANYTTAKSYGTGVDQPVHNVVYKKKYFHEKEKALISFGYALTSKKSATDVPITGMPYEFVIEVRKDGTPHPHAWARLPEIGRFENWGQANSFAVRIEWQDPPNSGKWRFRYLQAGLLYAQVDSKVPGSLVNYAKAIGFLQYLVNAMPNHQHKWIRRMTGSARVLQADYDMMNQSITFKNPTEQIRMLSGQARPETTIIAHMNQPKYALQNVDGAFGVFNPGMKGSRHQCDTCLVIFENVRKGVFAQKTCTRLGNGRVCTVCVHFGRPCCSWTKDLKPDDPAIDRSAEQTRQTATTVSALANLPVAPIQQSFQGFVQNLRVLESSEQLIDDGSDCDEEEDFGGADLDDE